MRHFRIIVALSSLSLSLSAASAAGDPETLVRSAGVTGGVIVHLGCGDGKATARLLVDDRFVVHGLDTDADDVRAAREHARSLGLYGRVTIDSFDGRLLPYTDSMVNLLVADSLGRVPRDEVKRVLAPNGVAWIGGEKTVKAWPSDIDEWTHYLHGPDNNAVAADERVGPPRHLQWQGAPKWPRHHDKMSSLSALVSTGGRIFYIIDEGSTASIFLPSRWALIARDAFNGKILWKRRVPTWFTRFKGLKDGPADAPRRLVASGERVYATLDLDGSLSCLDAVTGKTVRVYEGTDGAEEVLLSGDDLFVLVGPHSIGDGGRRVRPVEKRRILAFRADSGEKLWEAAGVVAALTLAVDGARAYYFDFEEKKVVGLDRRTGAKLWSSVELPAPERQMSFFASKLVVHDGIVLFASGEHSGMTKSGGGETRADTLTALEATGGKTLWTAPHPPSGYSSPEDLFVIDGLVWCENSSNGRADGRTIARDLRTGKVKHSFPADETSYWFHHRCYPGRATKNYLMTSRTGLEFIDLEKRHWDLNHWVRGACLYGVMPSNGLIYTPPAPCACYAETYLHSFNAFSAARSGSDVAARIVESNRRRLTRGSAYAERIDAGAEAGDWPTYRGSNARRGMTAQSVPGRLKESWALPIGGKLSSVTAADGKVFVAAVDRHEVHAVDAATGRAIWRFTAGGRVDSPPTWHSGRVLFGSADGCVYCLRATDGALVWKFLAAPTDRRLLSYEQIESVWPVHGSVLVRDDIAHFVAGRSIFVDGGMRLYRLDAKTGAVVSMTVLDDRNPATGGDVQELIKWLNMPGGRPDILSSDGKRLYLRSQAFDLEGKRLRMGPQAAGPAEGARQGGEETHLFCPTGFLDDTWFHRTYWLYGSTWGSGWNGYFVAGKHAPAGKILCVGDEHVYAFGREPQYYRWTTPMEYRLFAAEKKWKPALAARRGQPADVGSKKAASKKAASKKGAGKKKQGQAKGKGKGKGQQKKAKPSAPVTNPKNYAWTREVPILVRAMTLAGDVLFVAGPDDLLEESGRKPKGEDVLLRQEAALAGKSGGLLWAVSTEDGQRLSEVRIDSPPVFDGMAAAGGRLFMTTVDGKLRCFR